MSAEHARCHFGMRCRPGNQDVDDAIDHLPAQHCRARNVRIHVESDRLASAGGVEMRKRLHGTAPVGRPCALVVRYDHRHLAAASGGEGLVERVEDLLVFVADMGRVHAARFTGNAREQHEFIDVGRGAGRIEHAGTKACRARFHAFAQQFDHPRLLGAGGGTVWIVHRRHAQRRMSDQRCHVDRRSRLPHSFNVRGHRRIDVLVIAKQVEWRRRVRVYQRRQADAAIADDDGGHALADLRQHLAAPPIRSGRRAYAHR